MSSTNATVKTIIARMPNKPLLSPRDISDALGTASTRSVLNAIECGDLTAIKINGKYTIARTETIAWLERSAT